MKARFRKVIASALAIAMISSLPVTSAAANTAAQSGQSSYTPYQYSQGTKDLINKAINDLIEKGQIAEPKSEDKQLAAAVQEMSGLSLGAVKTAIGLDLFSRYNEGMIDTARFNLDEETMSRVLEDTLWEYSLMNAVTPELVVDENGIVTGIRYEMRSALAAGLDEIASYGSSDLTDMISAQAQAQAAAEPSASNRSTSNRSSAASYALTKESGEDEGTGTGETEPHEHKYGDPTFLWNEGEDGWTCQVVLVCDCGHSEFEECDKVSYIATEEKYEATYGTYTSTLTPPVATHGHEYTGEPAYYWSKGTDDSWTGCKAVLTCECRDTDIIGGKVVKDETPAQPGVAGKITYTATFGEEYPDLKDTKEVEIPAEPEHTHSYGEPVFVWTDTNPEAPEGDGKYTCTATRTCTDADCNETQTVDCNVTYQVTEEPNYEKDGKGTYTATAAFEGMDAPATDTKTVTLPKLTCEHTEYNNPEFKWTENKEATEDKDKWTCTATRTCTECGATQNATECVVEYKVTKEPTYTEEGEGTYTATATFEGMDAPATNTKTVTLAPKEHHHTLTATFNWDKTYVENPDDDKDGKPDVYFAFDPQTRTIGYSDTRTLQWNLQSATLSCSDKDCPDPIHKDIPLSQIDVQTVIVDEAAITPDPETGIPQWQNPFDLNSVVLVATYTENGNTYTEAFNTTQANISIHMAEMSEFYCAFPEHFGLTAPLWGSQDTDGSMIGAVKYLCNLYPDTFVPAGDLDYMLTMLPQAFMAYELMLGDALDMKIQDFMDYLNSAGKITDVQKLLLIHDWLANNSNFDMAAITAMKSGESVGSDPAQMTAFGALLYELLGQDGCICLGYAATYSLLVQYAFPEIYKSGNSWKTVEEVGDNNMVDLVQIRFYANIAENSAAGSESGFGDPDQMFNEPHYFNAVKLDGDWFYVDACYDDIYLETMTQYRVETDGNFSHNYFLFSPESALEMFDKGRQNLEDLGENPDYINAYGDSKIDYIESLYDGVKYERIPILDENGNQAIGQDLSPAYQTDDDGHVLWVRKTNDEKSYDNTTYEETWFTGAKGEVNFDDDYWYYVAGEIDSYAAMSDLLEGMEGSEGDMGDMGDFDIGDLMGQEGPEDADKLVRRPKTAPDEPGPEDMKEEDYEMGGQMGTHESYDDSHDEVLFHFGFGTLGESKNETYGPYEDLVKLDAAYRDQYPDLAHSSGLYNGTLYFNVANRIYYMDPVPGNDITLLKEYNTVYAKDNGKAFTGMSFDVASSDTDPDYVFTITDHPLSGISIEDKFIPTVDENGNINGHELMPMLTVSIGTNYSESAPVMGYAQNPVKDEAGNVSYTFEEDLIGYQVESFNYNPDFVRQYAQDDDNTNTEFMWCANVVERLPMQYLLGDLAGQVAGDPVEVTVDSYCGRDSYTELRTPAFGLTAGERTIHEGTALEHVYQYSEGNGDDAAYEQCYVCVRCGQTLPLEVDGNDPLVGQHIHEFNDTPTFTWSDGNIACTATYTCKNCDETVELPCTMFSIAEEAPTETEEGSGPRIATSAIGPTLSKVKGDYSSSTIKQDKKTVTYRKAIPGLTVLGGQGHPGDQIIVPVTINFNASYGYPYETAFAQLLLTLTYDSDKLEFVSCDPTPGGMDLANDPDTSNPGVVSLQLAPQAPELQVSKKSGYLLLLSFTIKEDAEGTEEPIEISIVPSEAGLQQGGAAAIVDADGNYLPCEITNGNVYVLNYVLGDVNGDGNVTRADLTLLAQYFAGKVTEDDISKDGADIVGDKDGVTRADLTYLAKYFAGQVELPNQ